MYKFYTDKSVVNRTKIPREKRALISVNPYLKKNFESVDHFLEDCVQRYHMEWIRPMDSPTKLAWEKVMKSTNAVFNCRGANYYFESLQFGGNKEFWSSFESEQAIHDYFLICYDYAIRKIGFLHTIENIMGAVIVTEPNRRNLFVYYLPITEKWQSKVMSDDKSEAGNKLQLRDEDGMPIYEQRVDVDEPRLSHTEFWKVRGDLTSYSDLQEDFFKTISEKYGAVRGESYSLIKNTNVAQRERYDRHEGDEFDEIYFDDMPY